MIIAANLTRLRQQAGLTQLQLAEMLNYSDKAVSKWERGESIPDLRILIRLAEIYNIKLDDIVHEPHEVEVKPRLNLAKKHLLITLLSIGLVWVITALAFLVAYYTLNMQNYAFLAFLFAPLVSAIVFTVFSAVWYRRLVTTFAVSMLIWSVILIVHIFLWLFSSIPVWPFYVVAAGLQLLVIGWFVLRKLYKPKTERG